MPATRWQLEARAPTAAPGSALTMVPGGAVTLARIARAAAVYLARTGRGEAPARFDVIGVDWCAGEPRLVLVRNAFESPL